NKPVAGWSAGEQRELWGVVDRVQVFIDALQAARAAGARLGFDDVKDLMRRAATSDIFAARIVPFLEDAVAGLDPANPRAAAVAPVQPGFLPPSRNYFDDVTSGTPHPRAEVLRAALESALAALTARLGTDDQSQWQMPTLLESYRDLGAIGPVFGPTVMER